MQVTNRRHMLLSTYHVPKLLYRDNNKSMLSLHFTCMGLWMLKKRIYKKQNCAQKSVKFSILGIQEREWDVW